MIFKIYYKNKDAYGNKVTVLNIENRTSQKQHESSVTGDDINHVHEDWRGGGGGPFYKR